MENQNPSVPILWEHSLTTLLGHDSTSDPGIALRQWVHFALSRCTQHSGPTQLGGRRIKNSPCPTDILP